MRNGKYRLRTLKAVKLRRNTYTLKNSDLSWSQVSLKSCDVKKKKQVYNVCCFYANIKIILQCRQKKTVREITYCAKGEEFKRVISAFPSCFSTLLLLSSPPLFRVVWLKPCNEVCTCCCWTDCWEIVCVVTLIWFYS